jgi:hypothetical protein
LRKSTSSRARLLYTELRNKDCLIKKYGPTPPLSRSKFWFKWEEEVLPAQHPPCLGGKGPSMRAWTSGPVGKTMAGLDQRSIARGVGESPLANGVVPRFGDDGRGLQSTRASPSGWLYCTHQCSEMHKVTKTSSELTKGPRAARRKSLSKRPKPKPERKSPVYPAQPGLGLGVGEVC